MAESEVAQLRKKIEQEYEAAKRGLQSYAVVSRHEFINARMEKVAVYHKQLKVILGDKEAVKVLYDVLTRD